MAYTPSYKRNKNVLGSGLNRRGWENAWQKAAGVPTPEQRAKFIAAANAGKAPAPQGLPVDPIYTEQTGQNLKNYQSAQADIQYGQGQLGQTYGFNASGQTDMSNPYNRATMLQRSYQQAQSGRLNSMAARGQLYAGATQRNLDEGTFQYGRNYDALKREAADAFHRYDVAGQQATSAFGQANLDAGSDRVDRASRIPPTPAPAGPSEADIAKFIRASQQKKPGRKHGQLYARGRRSSGVEKLG